MVEAAISSSPLMSSPAATAPLRLVHVRVTILTMFLSLLVWATYFCRSAEAFAINAMVLVYHTAIIYLELLRKRRSDLLDQVIWPLELIAAGITVISMVTAFLVFQPDRRDLSHNVIFSFLCLALAIQLDRHNIEREDAKYQDASDLV